MRGRGAGPRGPQSGRAALCSRPLGGPAAGGQHARLLSPPSRARTRARGGAGVSPRQRAPARCPEAPGAPAAGFQPRAEGLFPRESEAVDPRTPRVPLSSRCADSKGSGPRLRVRCACGRLTPADPATCCADDAPRMRGVGGGVASAPWRREDQAEGSACSATRALGARRVGVRTGPAAGGSASPISPLPAAALGRSPRRWGPGGIPYSPMRRVTSDKTPSSLVSLCTASLRHRRVGSSLDVGCP